MFETFPEAEPSRRVRSELLDDEEDAEAPEAGDAPIEHRRIDRSQASQRFRHATPAPEDSGVHRTRAHALEPAYEAEPERGEPPWARLARLQDEARELEAQLQDGSRGEQPPAVRMLEHVHQLQRRLQRIEGDAGPPEVDTAALIRALGGAEDGAEPPAAPAEAGAPPAARAAPPVLAALDERLAALESAVGVRQAAPESAPLLATLARLEQQMQLLAQPRHLDMLRQRAKLLTAELDRVAESRKRLGAGDALAPHTLARLEELHALQGRIEPLIPLAPALLTRLQTLAPLHASASSLAAQVERLEQADAAQATRQRELNTMLQRLEESMRENAGVVHRNMEALEQRVEALGARIGDLGAERRG